MIETREMKVLSSDGIHMLAGVVYLPEGTPRGIFHVVHGMTEYIGRYDRFLRRMAMAGYIVCGYDHLGHGKTARDDSELGFIASEDGWLLLVRDVGVFAAAVRKKYGESLPYHLMGHSMGSFIVRLAAVSSAVPARLVVMGTGGPNPLASLGIGITGLSKAIFGEKHISKLAETMAFGAYNKRFKAENDRTAWLTKDLAVREKYCADKYCTFHFTVSAMQDLVRLNKCCNEDEWFTEAAGRHFPILLVSGAEDPVGSDGRGVTEVFNRLFEQGADVSMHLYPSGRHEILNDDTFDEVTEEILRFIAQ